MPVDRSTFPCWTCDHPQSPEARAFLASASDEDIAGQQSPGGYLLVCCHVKLAGVILDSGRGMASRGRP
jgi:hypothetical protein